MLPSMHTTTATWARTITLLSSSHVRMTPVRAMAMSLAFRQNGLRSAAASFSTSSSVLTNSSSSSSPPPKVMQSQDYPYPLYFHLIPRDEPKSASPAAWAAADGAFSTSAKKSQKEQVPVSTYALSFLPTFPKHHRQVVGYHSQKHPSAAATAGSEPFVIRPNRFTENEAFNRVLHE
ncbi:hypothetical protein BGZ73_002782, partial [Actinomortierella ambigua]